MAQPFWGEDIAAVLLDDGWYPVKRGTFRVVDYCVWNEDRVDCDPEDLDAAEASGRGFSFEADHEEWWGEDWVIGPLASIKAYRLHAYKQHE